MVDYGSVKDKLADAKDKLTDVASDVREQVFTGDTTCGLSVGIAAAICYLLGWITGVIMYFVEKDNKYVRFHAIQAVLFSVLVTVIVTVVNLLSFLSFGLAGLIEQIIALASLVMWVLLMVKAYKGAEYNDKYKVPFIGDFAEKNA